MATAVASRREVLTHTAARHRIRVRALGESVIRYGLALTIAWIGAMKFTAYEAGAIQGLVANSPLTSWIYSLLSVQGAAIAIGASELLIAAAIAARPWSARLAAAGSGLAAGMFLTTLSFLLSTPGATEATLGGFPALSVVPGQFLLKDIVLLGAAVWLTGEALDAAAGGQAQ